MTGTVKTNFHRARSKCYPPMSTSEMKAILEEIADYLRKRIQVNQN